MGWYRERNLKICDLIRMGAPVGQIAFKYNLTERSVNKIVKAFEDKNGE
jgi:DNA-binding NarL/FixJ family response regulator